MKNIQLGQHQSKTIAQVIYGDIKRYCLNNFERYFPWWLNEICKEKGKPFLKEYYLPNNQKRKGNYNAKDSI